MDENKKSGEQKKVLRRELLTRGAAVATGALAVGAPVVGAAQDAGTRASFPASTGYIVYDSQACRGCQLCMFACSMGHQGEANLSLSRIQIVRDAPSFTKFPNDVVIAVCRHCVTPVCVNSCPVGAARVDTANGNIRVIDEDKCVGCQQCLKMCPQRPRRTVWNPYKRKSSKCDMCTNAPYWGRKGGPEGEPACVTTCPGGALKLVRETPSQEDINGYDVNLIVAKPKGGFAKPGGAAKPAGKPKA
jgi:protein NrfC